MKPCRITVLALLALCLGISGTPAFANHFEYVQGNVVLTNQVIFKAATFNGDTLSPGDEIGVFTSDGQCAGAMVVKEDSKWGTNTGLSAWGDDGQTPAVDEGFDDGEDMTFRIWINSVDAELAADVVNIIAGDVTYYDGDPTLICSLEASVQNIPPSADLLDGALNFGTVNAGNPMTLSVRVHNAGGRDLVISGATIDGSEYFSTDFSGDVNIGWRDTATVVNVKFDPQDNGNFEATLRLATNDENLPELDVTLSGVGHVPLPPNIELSTTDYAFPQTRVGHSRNLTLLITNTGEKTLAIQQASFAGDNVFSSDFDGELDIAGGISARMLVTFTPADVADYSGTLTITSNDPDQGSVDVALSGAGILVGDPDIDAVATERFIPSVVVGTTSTWRMVLLNVGAGDLWVRGIGSDNNAFTTNFGRDSIRMRPDDMLPVMVTFAPMEEAYYSANLTVFSNDPDEGEFVCKVAGTGSPKDGIHFRYYVTQGNHSLFVESATLDGNALGVGDEVGVFTRSGMCAGGGAFDAQGRAGARAYADDEESPLVDGFVNEEPFTFMVWDAESGIQTPATADFSDGPNVFTADALSRLTLSAISPEGKPDIRISDKAHYFGQVDYDDHKTKTWQFTIDNIGPANLHVDAVSSDLDQFTVAIDGQFPVTLSQNQPLAVNVTFAPTAEQDYVGRLTVYSNDPTDSVLYVDVYGTGVVEVQDPNIHLAAANYFFGVKHDLNQGDDPYVYGLDISNAGGGQLFLDGVSKDGSDAFSTSFDGERVIINSGDTHTLDIYFMPTAAQEYDATFTLTSADPLNPTVTFAVRGFGSTAADHYLHYQTRASHAITVDDAIIHTLEDQDLWLESGDEVAVFTPSGLCAGHTVVTAQMVTNTSIPLTAWGNDPDTPFEDGLNGGDAFTFKFWDWTVGDELDANVQYVAGQQVFTVNGRTTVKLDANALHSEAQITVDERVKQFGTLHKNANASRTWTITNVGGKDLTISRVESNKAVFTTDFAGETTLGHNESLNLGVTFTPDRNGVGTEGTVTIFSNDPNDSQFDIYPCGMCAQTDTLHFAVYRVEQNHSILIENADIGGAGPAIGDEFAAFTTSGNCAGAFRVSNPDDQIGIAAWGDDRNTTRLVEGFVRNEAMTIHFWDASQHREYIQGAEEFPLQVEVSGDGDPLNWKNFGVSFVNVTAADVIVVKPIAPFDADEGSNVQASTEILNAGENAFQFSIQNAPAGLQFNDHGDNTASFSWDISYETITGANRPYHASVAFTISATCDAIGFSDKIEVDATIYDIDRAPRVANPLQNDQLTINEDAGKTLVGHLSDIFADDDGDAIQFSAPSPAGIRADIDFGVPAKDYYVTPDPDASGQYAMVVHANDSRQGRDSEGRALRRVDNGINRDQDGRLLRKVDGGGMFDPQRDKTTDYEWTLTVTAVNDAPVITQPSDQDVFQPQAVQESVGSFDVSFKAGDVDNASNELHWAVTDDGDVPNAGPDAYAFVDNGDGTARFTWSPANNRWRQQFYTPVFRVTDPAGLHDDITLNLHVTDLNNVPVVSPDAPPLVTIREDGGRQVIADLGDIFSDADAEDAVLADVIDPNPPELQLEIIDNVLYATPIKDFNTWPDQRRPHRRASVTAEDHAHATATWAFQISVTPVDDPLDPQDQGGGGAHRFVLVTPQDGFVVTNLDSILNFTWTACPQPKYEIDAVNYWGSIKFGQDTAAVGPLAGLTMRVNLYDVARRLGWNGDSVAVTWDVFAHDTTSWAKTTNGRFTLILRKVGVKEEEGLGLPEAFFLAPTYPNPFNAQTSVKFGLPTLSDVNVTVWDMHGRLVTTLAAGKYKAGRYEAIWDAAGQSSGVYIIKMSTGNFRGLQKAILIR